MPSYPKLIFPSDLLTQSPSIVRFKLFKSSDPETPVHTILLPVPLALNSAYNVSFDDLEAGLIEKTVTGGVNAANEAFDALNGGINLENSAKAGAVLASAAADVAFNVVGGSQILRRALGSSVNKRNELVINQPTNRQFSLRFQLVPSNEEESTSIQKIIQVFKIAMHPPTNKALGKDSFRAGGIFFLNPAQVKIDFLFNRKEDSLTEDNINRKIFSTNFCFIESLDVNYHEAGAPAYFNDGQPGNMSFSITLKEIRPNSREMIQRIDYGQDTNIGFDLFNKPLAETLLGKVAGLFDPDLNGEENQ
jgi:hypothetical protein